MGAHYGSIHVRTEDREQVKSAAETVAREKEIHVYLSPPRNGWASLFPEGNGQDQTVAQELSRHTPHDVLHLMVHDDDVFAYWYFRGGEEIDSYWSAPGYFGEENRAAEEQMKGNPELFRPIIGERVPKLAALLQREEIAGPFASDQLEQVAGLLGIDNAANAYEYLKEDHSGVKGWRQFEEIPADRIADEAQTAKAEQNQIKALRRQLKTDRLLLFREEHKEETSRVCAVGNGFVVAWPDYRGSVSFETYSAPWAKAVPLPLNTPAHITAVASDAAARRVVMAAGSCVRVWDVRGTDWQQVADIPEHDLAIGVAISANGEVVAHASRQGTIISEVSTGRRLHAFTHPSDRLLAFHPSGDWLIAAGNTIGLIAMKEQWKRRELYVGGKNQLAAALTSVIASKFSEIDLDEFDRQTRKSMEAMLNKFSKMRGRGVTDEQLEAMRQNMEKGLEEQRARVVEAKAGRLPPTPVQANEQVMCVGFSGDGRWFWCGTAAGLRVYHWSDVVGSSGEDMPQPAFTAEPSVQPGAELSRYIYAIAEDPAAPAIVYAGGTGRIYRMDLTNGQSRELVKLPGEWAVNGVTFSRDGKTLGVESRTFPAMSGSQNRRSRSEQRWAWELWSYERLAQKS
jgi:hypothetical protein